MMTPLSASPMRTEQDLIGTLQLPADALYGIQTQRAINLYPLNGEKTLADYPALLQALLQIKKIAARTNLQTGELDPALAGAIIAACDQLIAQPPADQFPVHAFHGGGGISANMNLNEVIANLANRDSFDQPPGSYQPIHPNDHVNLNNSTSDALSSACHIATIRQWQGLSDALHQLSQTFTDQGERWQQQQKISRTCLQDAVEISFQQFFSGYVELLSSSQQRLARDIEDLYAINLGGNIIGRPGDCNPTFFDAVMPILNGELQAGSYHRAANLFASSQNHDGLIRVASGLEQLARALIRIAKDLRLMASGPNTGFGEISLPAVQPGSSAMPGKINPTIPEFLIHCAMTVCGRCYSVQMTQDHGELDYSPWQSVVICNLLDSLSCLETGIRVFTAHCVSGIAPIAERNDRNINSLIPTVIRLKNQRGYAFTARIFKESGGDIDAIRRHLKPE